MDEIRTNKLKATNERMLLKSGKEYKVTLTPSSILRVRLMEGRDTPLANKEYILQFGDQLLLYM